MHNDLKKILLYDIKTDICHLIFSVTLTMETMKALRWYPEEQRLELVETPRPSKPGPHEIIVKVAYAGVCGSDSHIMNKSFSLKVEGILGHETSGVVTEIGKGVKCVSIGDRVTLDGLTYCRSCQFCKKGQLQLCQNEGLNAYIGIGQAGGWAEYLKLPDYLACVIPVSMLLKNAALGEPVSTVYKGWIDHAPVTPSKMLILGAGFLGTFWATLAHYNGYRDITLTQRSKPRREFVKNLHLGFKVYDPDELKKEIAKIDLNTQGFELIVDTSGNPEAIEEALPWLRNGGKFILYGLGPDRQIKINIATLFFKCASIVSANCGAYAFLDAVQIIGNMTEKYLDFQKLGIGIFTLDQYKEAFAALNNKIVSKVMFQLAGE